ALDAEKAAQDLEIGDEMRGRVVLERAERCRAAGAALIENDDAVEMRVEETAMRRGRARAGSAMQEDDRHPMRIAGLLPVHGVEAVELERAGGVGLNRGEEILA